jgi:hypothetical protein
VAALAVAALFGWAMLRDADTPGLRIAAAAESPQASTPVSAAEPASASTAIVIDTASNTDDEIQACGGAWVKAGADGRVSAEETAAFDQRMLEATKAPTLATMQASADARTQAAAELVQMNDAATIGPCDNDDTCTRAADLARQAADVHRAALVRLAQGSTDPQVYAWPTSRVTTRGRALQVPASS